MEKLDGKYESHVYLCDNGTEIITIDEYHISGDVCESWTVYVRKLKKMNHRKIANKLKGLK